MSFQPAEGTHRAKRNLRVEVISQIDDEGTLDGVLIGEQGEVGAQLGLKQSNNLFKLNKIKYIKQNRNITTDEQ